MNLISLRIKAFSLEALALIGTVIGGVLVSDGFRGLITEHFGESVATSIILLVVTGLVKHLRNLKVIGKLGSSGEPVQLL